jgi:hypothetical protein
VFARKFDLDVKGSSIRDAMTPDVSFAMMTDVHDTTILGVELPYCVVTRYAAVLTEGYYDFVL